MKKNHFLVLDSFRGLCACFVALSHFNANSIIHDSPIFDRGSIWVDFFFVLSGFVITSSYMDKLQKGFGIGKFMFLRFGRLYPLHFAVLMAFLIFDALQLFIHIDGAALHKPFSGPGESWGAVVANLLLVHSLGVVDRFAYNGPSWSISVEFYTYLLFAFVFIWGKTKTPYITGLLALVSATILYIYHPSLFAKLDFGFFRGVYGFGCGVLVYLFYRKFNPKINEVTQHIFWANIFEIFVFSLMLIFVYYFAIEKISLLAPFIFSLVILIFSLESGIVSKILKHRFFLFLGILSYSIYMTHMFIGGKFFKLPIRLLEEKFGWNISYIDASGETMYGITLWHGTLLEIFYIIIVISCSYISYKIIEEPFRNWSKRIVKSSKA